jgi:hypothetical protein
MILAITIQSGLLIAVSTYVGLLAARAVGLGLPILEGILMGQPVLEKFLVFLPISLLVGLAAGGGIVALEQFVFQPRLPVQMKEASARFSLWKRALVCFYGGIDEELLLRLFVMSGLAWLLGLVWKSAAGAPALGAFWLANLVATLLFGAGHLPATARITRLTPLVVARALILNGVAGLMFGFLFMTYGLESAILAHFCMDILMHVVRPELTSSTAPKAQMQTVRS